MSLNGFNFAKSAGTQPTTFLSTRYEFEFISYEFESTSYEFEYTSYEFKSTSYAIK